jgi:formylglycine-generating enzyme required for sulfatase activity
VDTGEDGYKVQPAPVGCFPANGYGLYDMAGNVWEWTRDWYRPNLTAGGADPTGPSRDQALDPKDPAAVGPKHVVKGGSFLCADDYCFRYRPPAREAGPPDTGASHIGFRTVRRG